MQKYDMRGTIHLIMAPEQKTEKFKKRELIIKVVNKGSNTYTEYIKFQCINEKIDLLNDLAEKDLVLINFIITGRKYGDPGNETYYTNNVVEKIGVISRHATGPDVIRANDGNDYSEHLPGLNDGSVDLSGIGSAKPEGSEIPEKPIFDDLPF